MFMTCVHISQQQKMLSHNDEIGSLEEIAVNRHEVLFQDAVCLGDRYSARLHC